MKVRELKERIERYIADDPNGDALDKEVVIEIEPSEPMCGSTPHVEVKDAQFGFDWDHNLFLISPKAKLRE